MELSKSVPVGAGAHSGCGAGRSAAAETAGSVAAGRRGAVLCALAGILKTHLWDTCVSLRSLVQCRDPRPWCWISSCMPRSYVSTCAESATYSPSTHKNTPLVHHRRVLRRAVAQLLQAPRCSRSQAHCARAAPSARWSRSCSARPVPPSASRRLIMRSQSEALTMWAPTRGP